MIRLGFKFEPRDLWVGVYRSEPEFTTMLGDEHTVGWDQGTSTSLQEVLAAQRDRWYVCLVPTLAVVVEWTRPVLPSKFDRAVEVLDRLPVDLQRDVATAIAVELSHRPYPSAWLMAAAAALEEGDYETARYRYVEEMEARR